jgi:hypothetical protein
MINHETMPLSALPYFLKISLSFTNALEESVAVYKSDRDREAFSKILHHLSTDLDYYLNVYQEWLKDPKASAHQRDLAMLNKYLQEAKSILTSSVELVRH